MKRDTPLLVAVAMTGLAALALEVLWSRAMIPWVGGTALSQITTVGIYMAGLFVGSAIAIPWLRRVADPRASFLRVEMAAAVLSLAAVLGLPLADPLFALFSRGELLGSGLGSILRGLAGAALMIPATVLMGFSFPLAIAALDRGAGARGSAALAYGVNTLGATLGTLIGGFLLVPLLGVKDGAIAIVIADLALLAWASMRKPEPEPRPADARAAAAKSAATPPLPSAPAAAAAPAAPAAASWRDELPMLASILLGGMVSLGLEAILFRVLGLLLGPTARAFTVVLAVYVLGLGVGSLLVRRIVGRSRRAAELVYLGCWVVVGAYGLIVHTQTGHLSELVASGRSVQDFNLTEQLALRAVIATLVLLPITCAFGASYSAAVAAAARTDARRAGRLYAALTLGNIVGLGVAAWGVLPNFRLDRGLLVVLASAFLVPLAALSAMTLPRVVRWGAAAGFLAGGALAWFTIPRWPMRLVHTAAYMYDSSQKGPGASNTVVRFHRSAFETSVTVVQIGENLYLQLDGKTTGSTDVDDQATQGLLGALPAALHPDAKSGFIIGLGTGHTPAELLRHPLERVDCAEISPEVVLTMEYFEAINRRCDRDPRLRMLEADGRTVLRYGGTKYDLVISEPSNVWIPGVAHLFTRESFTDVRNCLAPRGVCVQWLQGYGLQVDTLRTVVRTFLDVFPNTSLWFSGLANPDIFLVGSLEPFTIDPVALDARLLAVGALNVEDHHRPMTAVALLRRFIAGPDRLRAFAGPGPLTSDARPSLEYAAEEALIGGSADPARRMIAELCEPPLALLRPAADGGGVDPTLARTLTRRAEGNRAISLRLAEINAADVQLTDAMLDGFFALAQTFADDGELRGTMVASLAFPIGLRIAKGERSQQLFDFMRRVIAVDPDHAEALKLALVLAGAERRAIDALALVDRFEAASQPWRVEPLLDRGMTLWDLGRPVEAVKAIAQSVERSPWYVSAWRSYSQVLKAMGDAAGAEKAERRLRKLLEDPE